MDGQKRKQLRRGKIEDLTYVRAGKPPEGDRVFTPYSKFTPEQQAVIKLKTALCAIPKKWRKASRVVMNAISHLEGREPHPDNRESVKEIWPTLRAG